MNPELNSSTDDGALRFRTGAAMLARLGSEQLKDEITALGDHFKTGHT